MILLEYIYIHNIHLYYSIIHLYDCVTWGVYIIMSVTTARGYKRGAGEGANLANYYRFRSKLLLPTEFYDKGGALTKYTTMILLCIAISLKYTYLYISVYRTRM